MRGKKRIHGILDPLLEKLAEPPIEKLAEELGVTRQSIHRWQNGSYKVSPFNKMKINLLCLSYGVEQIFKE